MEENVAQSKYYNNFLFLIIKIEAIYLSKNYNLTINNLSSYGERISKFFCFIV